MKQVSENYLKRTVGVIGSDHEFVLTLGAGVRYYGHLEDRAVNDMERWGISEIDDGGRAERAVMTHRFEFSVNEETDLRAVAELFIERLGVTDYTLNITFS